MTIDWTHAGPPALAAFLASLVEFVEALTIVLAVGATRGWRSALAGTVGALALLLLIVAILGPLLTEIPERVVQLVVGALILLFGLRWLRKAILRAAGIIPVHDEATVYNREIQSLGTAAGGAAWDRTALAAAFNITLLEGIEVVFIVVAVGAGGPALLAAASAGALAALLLVILLGVLLHRPIVALPENTLKFVVGVLLCGFGTFWLSEGLGVPWPGGDLAVLVLVTGFLLAALAGVKWKQRR